MGNYSKKRAQRLRDINKLSNQVISEMKGSDSYYLPAVLEGSLLHQKIVTSGRTNFRGFNYKKLPGGIEYFKHGPKSE